MKMKAKNLFDIIHYSFTLVLMFIVFRLLSVNDDMRRMQEKENELIYKRLDRAEKNINLHSDLFISYLTKIDTVGIMCVQIK